MAEMDHPAYRQDYVIPPVEDDAQNDHTDTSAHIHPTDTRETREKRSSDGSVTLPGHEDGAIANVAEADFLANGDGDEIQYRTMEWYHCGTLMIAECISLGILALPHTMAQLGLFGGLTLIIGMGIIAGYTGYVIGQFKLKYPQCHSMADAGMVMFGPWGRELLGLGQVIVLVFIMAAHISSFKIMMNVLTKHKTCSIVFSVIGLIVSFFATFPKRQLKYMSWLSILSCVSIISAVFVVMVVVGATEPGTGQVVAFQPGTLSSGMNAALNIILAYSGHVTYFGFASELRDPREFTKSLVMLQTTAIVLYSLAAVVIYIYAGRHVPSPALGAAGSLWSKVAYGIASLTIIIAGVVNGHVASKYIYVRVWGATKFGVGVIKEKGLLGRSYLSWVSICAALWIISWIIAEAIPVFKYLLALVAALFSGWYSYGITGIFWLYMNKGMLFSTKRKAALTILNVGILCMGCIICGLGLYATGKSINDGQAGKPFSCADTRERFEQTE